MSHFKRRNRLKGILFISPWILGFIAFSVYPIVSSIIFAFTDYSVLSSPIYIGTANFEDIAFDDIFWKSMVNTLGFSIVSVPINLILACGLALLLNFNIHAKGLFRTLFFLPSLVPMVCLGVIWRWLLNGELGLVNQMIQPALELVSWLFDTSISAPSWLEDPLFTKPGLVIAGMWGVGHSMVIFLAGMQEAPKSLYEAAEIDGAGFWSKLRHVTIPMLTPYILFNLVMGIIGSFQIFAMPYVLIDGANQGADGPGRSLLFTATYIFQKTFRDWDMGYACAISLIFIALIATLTLSVMKLTEHKTYYAGK
ncbi:sugar ABC transporter permease [Puniceicoccaceae bacterium K14]|nr:sugar ABC transporter permease [Puniceicoccaceae bacterium K14]